MNNFHTIYKILHLLDKNKGREDFDYSLISAKAMKIEFAEWEQLMIEMQEAGFIRGLLYAKGLGDKFPHIVEPICPQITLKGMEYLAGSGMMAKAKEALRLAAEFI